MTGPRQIQGRNLVFGALGLMLIATAAAIIDDDGGGVVRAATLQSGATVWDGVFTEEQATRGQEEYQRECAQCHLDDLLGDGIAPALIGAPFNFRWSDLSVGDMFAAIRTTMPQGAPASLSLQGYSDIISYLLRVNEFPAGDTELPTAVGELEQIIIQEGPPQ